MDRLKALWSGLTLFFLPHYKGCLALEPSSSPLCGSPTRVAPALTHPSQSPSLPSTPHPQEQAQILWKECGLSCLGSICVCWAPSSWLDTQSFQSWGLRGAFKDRPPPTTMALLPPGFHLVLGVGQSPGCLACRPSLTNVPREEFQERILSDHYRQ